MERKNSVEKETKEYSDSEDDNKSLDTEQDIIKDFDKICNARLRMIEYCDEMAVPLCDYLSQDIIEDFVKFLNFY